MDNMEHILKHLSDSKDDHDCVLATVIHVDGSAYRKEGATMLFTGDICFGTISAGCLETDLAIQAEEMLQAKRLDSKTIIYDMRAEDDMGWGRGAGCNGKVHILLERVTTDLRKHLNTLYKLLRAGVAVKAIKQLTKTNAPVPTFYVAENGQLFGQKLIQHEAIMNDAQHISKSQQKSYDVFDMAVFFHQFVPKPRLFIFGAGPDVEPLSLIANLTGISVHIWDWRQTKLKQSIFPQATFIQVLSLEKLFAEINFVPSDSIIIMTHDFQKDQTILQLLLNKDANLSYIGILGPRKRTSRLLGGEQIPAWLHSPVGLQIGADGPEEIATSIVADLIKSKREIKNTPDHKCRPG